MKTTIKIFILSVIIAASITSCKKDFFKLPPYNGSPANGTISSDADMNVLANGMYAGLRSVNLYGRALPVKGDLAADNVYLKTGNSGRHLVFRDFNETTANGEAAGAWNDAYATIKDANQIINSTLTSTPVVDELKGEAYAVRALMHFELVRNFATPYTVDQNAAGIPIVTSYNQSALPARNTVKEVYTQIISDLNQAFSMISLNQGQSITIKTTNYTREMNSEFISKYAAKGLLAKVYLTMGDWQNAKAAATDVISNSGFSLVTAGNYTSFWANPAARTDKVETLFEVSSDAASNLSSDQLSAFYQQPPIGYGDLWITNDLYSQYSATDVRRNVILLGNSGGNTVYFNNKYSNTANPADKDDIKVLRYADVVLILAEANANLSDETNAKIYLNAVAESRDPSFAGYSSTGAQLKSDIINERRKELAFEGDRYWDFMRLNLPITNHIKTQNPYVAFPIPITEIHRLFPIPQSEMDVNPNITQNAGYN
ncbi:MAG: RagB/SusD family nutrient uptake outer membrane protein [Bacteroidetes bacterium]|nr:RagB/SusD family nutrient uptake outer membrane protein [Bacteroidota bacterium]MBS1932120.1 RagB/SusD family nutrient uptake outer membrane protein [Bacteroidota bacterium]